jgi:hypothetical protein
MEEITFGQNLFETIQNVTGFTPLESDMQEIINAVKEDNELVNETKLQSNSNPKPVRNFF